MPYIENTSEFSDRHGGEYIKLNEGREMLFADGAKIIRREFQRPEMCEPPIVGTLENLNVRLQFASIKLNRTTNAFSDLKACVTGTKSADAAGLPWGFSWDVKEFGPHPDVEDEFGLCPKAGLNRLKEIAAERRKAVNKLRKEIADHDDTREMKKRARAARRAEQQRLNARDKRIEEIESISL